MSNLSWLTNAQVKHRKPFSSECHGKPRVDDRSVLGGIIVTNSDAFRWCDAQKEYGPAKTLYYRWKPESDNGVFARIMVELAAESAEHKTLMIDATHLKAHRTASNLRVKKERHRREFGRTKGGMNIKLHAIADTMGRPIGFYMSARPVSGYTGAAAMCYHERADPPGAASSPHPPDADGGSHEASNGLLLHRDVHSLLDAGYVTATPEMRFEVSRRIREEFDNGKHYYALQGQEIARPDDPKLLPDRAALAWHNEQRFNG